MTKTTTGWSTCVALFNQTSVCRILVRKGIEEISEHRKTNLRSRQFLNHLHRLRRWFVLLHRRACRDRVLWRSSSNLLPTGIERQSAEWSVKFDLTSITPRLFLSKTRNTSRSSRSSSASLVFLAIRARNSSWRRQRNMCCCLVRSHLRTKSTVPLPMEKRRTARGEIMSKRQRERVLLTYHRHRPHRCIRPIDRVSNYGRDFSSLCR